MAGADVACVAPRVCHPRPGFDSRAARKRAWPAVLPFSSGRSQSHARHAGGCADSMRATVGPRAQTPGAGGFNSRRPHHAAVAVLHPLLL